MGGSLFQELLSPFLYMHLPIVAMLVYPALPVLGADRPFPERACSSASPWELRPLGAGSVEPWWKLPPEVHVLGLELCWEKS